MINNEQQWATMSNSSPLKVRIADSVSCSIVASTWPREASPARATWWNQTNFIGIILNREYLSVSSTGDRGVCIIKDGLVTIFLRGHRAAVGEAGICHLRWFRHLKIEFARFCDQRSWSKQWLRVETKNYGWREKSWLPVPPTSPNLSSQNM